MCVGSNTNAGTTYGLNLPSSPVIGTSASLTVIDRTKPFDHLNRSKTFEVVVGIGDIRQTIVAALIAKINAYSKGIVTAANVDTTNHNGFKLTAKVAGKDFTVVCGGILSNADVLEYQRIVNAGTAGLSAGDAQGLTTTVVKQSLGRGTVAQIAGLETEFAPMDGDGPREKQLQNLYTAPTGVVIGETYAVTTLRSVVPNDNVLIPKENMTTELQLAIPATEYGVGESGTLLDAILAAFNV
jgi:hypothetical protein